MSVMRLLKSWFNNLKELKMNQALGHIKVQDKMVYVLVRQGTYGRYLKMRKESKTKGVFFIDESNALEYREKDFYNLLSGKVIYL